MHHRFSVDSTTVTEQHATLRGDEFHHAVRVRRVRVGETVEIFDERGRTFEAVIDTIGNDEASLRVLQELPSRESSLRLTLALALIQPDRFELVLQKATELGVTAIVPVLSERVEVRLERVEKKRERWQRIINEAVKQCGRARSPVLAAPAELEDVIATSHPRFILDAEASRSSLDVAGSEVTMLIGPEGGFSEREMQAALAAGCHGLRLGPRRLRAETAAIAAVVLAQSEWGDLA